MQTRLCPRRNQGTHWEAHPVANSSAGIQSVCRKRHKTLRAGDVDYLSAHENTPQRIRTSNLRFRRPMLYPIELGVHLASRHARRRNCNVVFGPRKSFAGFCLAFLCWHAFPPPRYAGSGLFSGLQRQAKPTAKPSGEDLFCGTTGQGLGAEAHGQANNFLTKRGSEGIVPVPAHSPRATICVLNTR